MVNIGPARAMEQETVSKCNLKRFPGMPFACFSDYSSQLNDGQVRLKTPFPHCSIETELIDAVFNSIIFVQGT